MATHSSILAWRSTWTVWKGKKIWPQKMNSPRLECVQYATGMRWLNRVTNSMDMNLSKLQESGGQRSLACCRPWGRKESTWHSNWTTTKVLIGSFSLLTQVRVPDSPWGETNWNVRVWSKRKVYCRAMEGDEVAHTLNCLSSRRVSGKHFWFWPHSAVYGILVPWPGTEPWPLSGSMDS